MSLVVQSNAEPKYIYVCVYNIFGRFCDVAVTLTILAIGRLTKFGYKQDMKIIPFNFLLWFLATCSNQIHNYKKKI